MRAAEETLTQQLSRAPDDRELARHLSVTEDDVLQARKATRPLPPARWTRRCHMVTIRARSLTYLAKTIRPSPTPPTSKPSVSTWTSCPNATSAS
jgi:Sigma-70 region 3